MLGNDDDLLSGSPDPGPGSLLDGFTSNLLGGGTSPSPQPSIFAQPAQNPPSKSNAFSFISGGQKQAPKPQNAQKPGNNAFGFIKPAPAVSFGQQEANSGVQDGGDDLLGAFGMPSQPKQQKKGGFGFIQNAPKPPTQMK